MATVFELMIIGVLEAAVFRLFWLVGTTVSSRDTCDTDGFFPLNWEVDLDVAWFDDSCFETSFNTGVGTGIS